MGAGCAVAGGGAAEACVGAVPGLLNGRAKGASEPSGLMATVRIFFGSVGTLADTNENWLAWVVAFTGGVAVSRAGSARARIVGPEA